MADQDHGSYMFALYITATDTSLAPEAILRALDDVHSPEDNPFIATSDQSFRNRNAQAVINHHRNIESPRNRTNKDMFLIVDEDLSKGVLIIHLNLYHGYEDGVRMSPGDARNAVVSMNIANTDWYEQRESEPEAGIAPRQRFALYITLSDAGAQSFEKALKWMNDGVGELGVEDQDPADLPIGAQRDYYCAVPASNAKIDELIEEHAAVARADDVYPDVFAVVDTAWESEGIVIVRISPQRSSFRCRTPVAGEILNWTSIGLMTWTEAEAKYSS